MTETDKQWPATVRIKVDVCPRCGGTHEVVEYRSFGLGDQQFTHWAYCEATGEPLLLNMGASRRSPDQFLVRFLGTGQKAKHPANPNYPEGVHLNQTGGVEGDGNVCVVQLPWPAKEIGAWKVECTICALRVACTTAGRPDDPRSITVRCNKPNS
jgi:hypothetical protein